MTNTTKYHARQNLNTNISNRISLEQRLRRAAAIRVARDYAQFRLSLGNLTNISHH